VDNNLRSPNSLAGTDLQDGGTQQQIQTLDIHVRLASRVEKAVGGGKHPLRGNQGSPAKLRLKRIRFSRV
jgi:hypothetical protein